MRRGALVLVGVALLGAGCGGDDDRAQLRKQLEAYSQAENRAVGRLRPDVDAINRSYVAFSRGKLEGGAAVTAMTRAEGVVRDVRREVYALDAPKAATELQRRLERYLDRTVALAVQTRRLASYQGAATDALDPLRGVNRRLQRELGDAKTPESQQAVLGRFASGVGDVVQRLEAVEVPTVQRPAHRDQLRRLERTRALALRLRRALGEQDAGRVATLLQRFRDQARERTDTRRLTRAGLRAYARQVDGLKRAAADVQREQIRLFRAAEPPRS